MVMDLFTEANLNAQLPIAVLQSHTPQEWERRRGLRGWHAKPSKTRQLGWKFA